jgi:hypothetical protein
MAEQIRMMEGGGSGGGSDGGSRSRSEENDDEVPAIPDHLDPVEEHRIKQAALAAAQAEADQIDQEKRAKASGNHHEQVPLSTPVATPATAPDLAPDGSDILHSMMHMSNAAGIPADQKMGINTVTVPTLNANDGVASASGGGSGTRDGQQQPSASVAASDSGVLPLSDGNVEFEITASSTAATVRVSAASLIPVTPEDADVQVWWYKQGKITNMLSGWNKTAKREEHSPDNLVWSVGGLEPSTTYTFKVVVKDVGEREQQLTTPTGVPQFTVVPSSPTNAFVTYVVARHSSLQPFRLPHVLFCIPLSPHFSCCVGKFFVLPFVTVLGIKCNCFFFFARRVSV